MEELLNNTDKGKKRKSTADNRINQYIAEKLDRSVNERKVQG